MNDDFIETGEVQAKWNVSGTRILNYSVEMCHKGLKEHKVIPAPEKDILKNKTNLQAKKWIEKWDKLEQNAKL